MKLLIFILFVCGLTLDAKLDRVVINPKNRVNLYFNTIPIYKSELSNDKKNVFLNLEDGEFMPRYSQVSGSGVVRFVNLSKVNNKVKVQIELSEPRGYTAIPLPFSNSVAVEAFSWEGISKEDDIYREALLAYESGNSEQAITLLQSVANTTFNADTKAVLGLLLIKEGRIVEAAKYIFEAHRDSSTYDDVYAALAEIFKWKGNLAESTRNDSLFRLKTKLSEFPSFAYSGNPDSLMVPNYYFSNENLSTNDSGLDTTIEKSEASNTFMKDYEEKSVGDLLGFSDGYLIFVIIILIFCALMLYYVYDKWKKNKILEFKNMSNNMFQEEIRLARKKQKAKIEEQQMINEELGITKKPVEQGNILKKKYVENTPDKKVANIKQFKVKSTKNVREVTNKEQLEKFLSNYIPLKRIEEEEKKEASKNKEVEYIADNENTIETSSPDVNLALRLAEEKNKIKQKQLIDLAKKSKEAKSETENEEIAESDKSSDDGELNNISQNKELITKLNKKFNVDNNKENE